MTCFVAGERNTFSIKIDDTEMVDQLKTQTVNEAALTLYRTELVPSSDEETFMNELERLSENLGECKELLGWLQLSTYFRERPPVDKIYAFLVQTPKGESIYCGDLSNAADGVVAD